MSETAELTNEITKMTAEIVVAYVSHNAISPTQVPTMISDVYDALARREEGRGVVATETVPAMPEGAVQPMPESGTHVAAAPEPAVEAVKEPVELRPAVPIERSVHPDFLICLEDGRTFRTLRRHLRTAYNMSPEEYKAKWGLPKDYPMVAPSYAEARSALAKKIGLGRLPTQPAKPRVAAAAKRREPAPKAAAPKSRRKVQ